MQQVSRLARTFGPYYLIFWFVVVGLVGLSLSRLGLMLWQWPRVSSAGDPLWMLVQGVRADLIVLGLWLALPVLLAPLLGMLRVWPTLLFYWCLSGLALLIFIELSTPSFIAQYDIRPNRLYIEYLKYPKEVFATLWHGFRLPLLLGSAVTVLLVWLAARLLGRLRERQQAQAQHVNLRSKSAWSRHKQLWLVWPLMVLLVFISIRSTTQHRPANPALFAITSDALVNSLIISSGYSVVYAVYSMRHEARSSDIYGELPSEQMLTLAKRWPWLSGYQFNHPETQTARGCLR
jgi:phosphoglycerol transferase MdoB-like AlkP superfamily enzyme